MVPISISDSVSNDAIPSALKTKSGFNCRKIWVGLAGDQELLYDQINGKSEPKQQWKQQEGRQAVPQTTMLKCIRDLQWKPKASDSESNPFTAMEERRTGSLHIFNACSPPVQCFAWLIYLCTPRFR